MKKFVAMAVALCLIAVSCVLFAVSSGGDYTGVDLAKKDGKDTVYPGETVEMQLVASGTANQKIAGFMYDISIDTSLALDFEKAPVTDGEDVLDADNVGTSLLDDGWSQFLTLVDDTRLNYMAVLMDTTGYAADGPLMDFSFTVPENAEIGDEIVLQLVNAGGPASADSAIEPKERADKGKVVQTLTLTVAEQSASFEKGDLNKDNAVDITDVMALCRVLARQASGGQPSDEERELGDINGDEAIDIQDVMGLCRILARRSSV